MNTQAQELATPQELSLNPSNPREREVLLVEREFSLIQRKAKALSSANIVPKDYQGNVPNCMIAMEMAQRLGAGELEIMQNLHVIQGRPSFSAAYLIARVNQSGILRGRLKFVMVGTLSSDDYGCYAVGTDRETGEELVGTTITIGMAKNEGWYGKNGSKWKTMPEQMLRYRAAAFWSRVNAPDATMGMHTTDEVSDFEEKEVNPSTGQISSVQEMLAKKKAEQETDVIDVESEVISETEKKQGQEPVQTKNSNVFVKLAAAVEMAESTEQLDSVISQPDWSDLIEGEPQQLQAVIADRRKKINAETQPTAEGIFEG